MLHPDLPALAAVAAIFVAAGAVKGVLGMGLPTVAIGLLGLVMPVAAAAALLTIPSFVTNVWQAFAGPAFAEVLRRLWPMLAGIAAGVLAVALLPAAPPQALARRLLGACLLAYAVLGLASPRARRLPARWEAPVGAAAGAATGIITGFTGVFVLPAVPYLQSLGWGKEALAQALGLCFAASTIALAALLAVQGHMDLRSSTASLFMVLPAVAGMALGQAIRARMGEQLFRRCFFVGLLLLGGWLAAR